MDIEQEREAHAAYIKHKARLYTGDPKDQPDYRPFVDGYLAALQSQTIPASDWFDMFMELARAVVVANRLFAVSPTTTKQKVAADAAIALQEHARKHPALQSQDRKDADRLDWLREETCDLRCINVPTGGDDYDVRWVVIQHHMSKPHEREIGRSFTDDPRDAIDHARRIEGES